MVSSSKEDPNRVRKVSISSPIPLDVSTLPGTCVVLNPSPSTDSVYVVECEDDTVEIIPPSPSPGPDGISNSNFSMNSEKIFTTNASGDQLPPVLILDKSKSTISLPESGSSTPPPSRYFADSRASLVSIGKKDETCWTILSQIGVPFIIAGLGMVGAGLLLDYVVTWEVFKDIGELVILVTPLLGLKGNLEMTLAARLSTHANIGNLNKGKGNKWPICGGNLILDQLQAIVCGFAASLIAVSMGYFLNGTFDPNHMSLVVVSSVLTASMVSLILGSTMISVILLSKKYKINPDNVATPVAGSLGDVVTLGMLSCFASIIYKWHQQGWVWVPYVIIGIYLVFLPMFFYLAFKNKFTRPVTISGWIPLLVSVAISTGGGILLDIASGKYPGVALYQPVINGIGGNLVSVQASRISSYLHGHCEKRILPDKGKVCETPFHVFLGKGINSMSARLLLMLAIPGHLLFSTVTHYVAPSDDTNYGPIFLFVYITAAVIQVSLLLYICKILTNVCWVRGVDPDSQTIPYLTAMGDFFGSALLFLAFEVLQSFGQLVKVT